MIGMIGLTLIPTAIEMSSGNFTIAFITLIIAVLMNYFSKGFLSQLSILIAIGTGYLLSASLGLVDYTPIKEASWILIPNFELPSFSIESILMIAPIVLATFMEHIGDIAANQEIVEQDFFSDPGLYRTLVGDGLATSLSGMIGGPANTTYSENTALLKITKNYNPRVLRIAAYFAIGLAFFGKVSGGLQSIPVFVLGGISIVLFWMISKTGLDTIINSASAMDWFNWVIVALMLVIGMGNDSIQKLFDINIAIRIGSFQLQGIGLAALVGIVLNILWDLKGNKNTGEM
jgi:uracil permease